MIWEEQVWVTTATPDGKELFAIAIDLNSGKIIRDIKVFDIAELQRRALQTLHISQSIVIEAQIR